jgi:polynucleotide 5'-kinase involved in rRNA processing
VNSDVLTRSEALLADIREALPRYVHTSSFSGAHEMLAEYNVVIIAGPQGVGKTTLAHLLLLDAVQAGYTPYRVQAGGHSNDRDWEQIDSMFGMLGPA